MIFKTCKEEILYTTKQIIKRNNKNEFTIQEVVKQMFKNETIYKESTIRTHIISKCCSNSPKNHGTVYNDFERIGSGVYKLLKPFPLK